MALILTICTVFVLLIASEFWWRTRKPHDELSRKFIHITVGSFAAFWPYFLSWRQILFLSAAFIVVVLASRYLNLFQAIHAVERPTWGEVYFAVAVGALVLLTHSREIYAVALLHMSLADGVAAVIGTLYGRTNSYKILGHIKSIAGSVTFLLISLCLLIGYATIASTPINSIVLYGLAAMATILENFSVRGLDNLAIPVVIALALTALS